MAFEHQVIEHARTHRIPCPRVILTLRGERIVERGSRLHSLYSWEPGAHAQRGQAGSVRAYAAGQMLATIHDALSTISEAPADNAGPGDLAETYCRMTHLEDAVRSVAVVSHVDCAGLERQEDMARRQPARSVPMRRQSARHPR